MRRLVRAAGLAVALATPAAGQGRAENCAASLAVRAFPDGNELARVALNGTAPAFTLTYRHSVTLTMVESRYTVEDGRVVHLAEAFADHGPGLAGNAAAPGARWERRNGRFILHERRVIERLVLRVHRDHGNRLDAAGPLDLTRWGNRALEIAPMPCAAGG